MTRGRYVRCGRCSQGQTFLNRRNGDTHCYQCLGTGLVYRQSAEEKAQNEARTAWFQKFGIFGRMHGPRKIETPALFMRACRIATFAREGEPGREQYLADLEREQADRARLERTTLFWVTEGPAAVARDWNAEDEAHKATAFAAARSAS